MADASVRLAAAVADRYRLERALGHGGMATVFLAHDLRHARDVAIKVLHPDLGAALGGERFLAEIRTTARLQHPHILPLLDSGDAGDGLLYYVMPVVRGETLRARLERERQLPVEDALRIAREVADALQHAHALGIIHRDIKPENILLQDDHALVADFGIALAVQQAGGVRMTQTGLSLGTPSYMSPEQAMGERTLDARSDVYALGAVAYEMLSGEPPFTGATAQAIVAKVLTERPVPLHTVRDTVPAVVEAAVHRALAKLPADRFESAKAFHDALGDPAFATAAPALARASRPAAGGAPWRAVALGTTALAAVALGALGWTLSRSRDGDADPFPYRLVVPDAGSAVLAPDAQSVAYIAPASSAGASRSLWVRRLDQLGARELAGTEQAWGTPAFSPDGRWLAFVADRRRLVKAPVDGGPAVTLGEVPDYGGLDWSARDELVLGAGVDEGGGGLRRLRASGGPSTEFTRPNAARGELSHQQPRVLADGHTVLFTIWHGSADNAEIGVADLDGGGVSATGIVGITAHAILDGHLIYSSPDGQMMAVPFDLRTRRVGGDPTPVQDSVRGNVGKASLATVTHGGGLAYERGEPQGRLVWVDRAGTTRPVLDALRDFGAPRLSPDARRIAVTVTRGGRRDIWTVDLAAGTLSPVTASGAVRNAAWTPDGKAVLYVSTQGGRAQLWRQPADRSAAPTVAADPHANMWNLDVAPDGRTIVYNVIRGTSFDVEAYPLDGGDVRPLADTPAAMESSARISPDGRWVAYVSNESGRPEAYVRSLADGGGRVQVSAAGADRKVVWGAGGREVYYRANGRMVAATLAFGPEPRVVARTPLFDASGFGVDFDATADGSRFVMVERLSEGTGVVVVPHWRTALRATLAGSARR